MYSGPTAPNADDPDQVLLRKIAAILYNQFGGLPAWTSRTFTYTGSTNNVDTITYKRADGTVVATVKYTYVASGAADDDDVASETVSLKV